MLNYLCISSFWKLSHTRSSSFQREISQIYLSYIFLLFSPTFLILNRTLLLILSLQIVYSFKAYLWNTNLVGIGLGVEKTVLTK